MGLSCFRAISGIGYGMGWDLCAGLLYEHRFAMLIIITTATETSFLEDQEICPITFEVFPTRKLFVEESIWF